MFNMYIDTLLHRKEKGYFYRLRLWQISTPKTILRDRGDQYLFALFII